MRILLGLDINELTLKEYLHEHKVLITQLKRRVGTLMSSDLFYSKLVYCLIGCGENIKNCFEYPQRVLSNKLNFQFCYDISNL